ncbi:MAG: C1 family peptidase [Flavicella sp.]|jgi:hypothetical protein|uniref:C1 family peptidase n=1 Tax=Formosa sp. Hel3_A1_48 TaxID=1336795 RepID=UPI00084E2BA3|nr:C1 family peptidase [Formosa sp. Hel3_A1_48]MDG2280110.1 C1 family peptidase [Flavicella sp.]|tara:strand:- start:3007 stop:4281 length:1275 start_codon:yes stop_codon:yes gene_type:complete
MIAINTIKKNLFVLLFVSTQAFSQGLILCNTEKKAMYPKVPAGWLVVCDTLPSSHSLEKFVPPVIEQNGDTSVGFASLYYALSTMYNIKFGITDYNEKYAHSFDPYFIYLFQNNVKENGYNGLFMSSVLDNLSEVGAKKLFYPPYTDSSAKIDPIQIKNALSYTTPYSINKWYYYETKNTPRNSLINIIKKNLCNNTPIITGFEFVNSMISYSSGNLSGVKSDGLWSPDHYTNGVEGHALCVVGYNDNKFGGAFRIVNSWGKNYGDNGYMWLKYDDFAMSIKEVFFLELNQNIKDLTPAVIETKSYKRFSFKNDVNDYNTYEGQYLLNGVNGYGILSNNEENSYYIGKFDNAKMTGFFLILDNDGISSANAVDGNLQSLDKLGFASDESITETQFEAKKYFKKLGDRLSIRKANSSRNSSKSKK